jgi:hypothetical protein
MACGGVIAKLLEGRELVETIARMRESFWAPFHELEDAVGIANSMWRSIQPDDRCEKPARGIHASNHEVKPEGPEIVRELHDVAELIEKEYPRSVEVVAYVRWFAERGRSEFIELRRKVHKRRAGRLATNYAVLKALERCRRLMMVVRPNCAWELCREGLAVVRKRRPVSGAFSANRQFSEKKSRAELSVKRA